MKPTHDTLGGPDPNGAAAGGDELNEGGPDELLVAYLDGQLSDEECERVEAMLASDTPLRERLQSLDRVWNALDALPRSTASPAFTRTTIDMAAVNASPLTEDAPSKPRRRVPLWLVACLGSVVLGAGLSLSVAIAPERRAAQDLPVALNANAMEQAGSVAFLERLNNEAARELEPFRSDENRAAADRWSMVSAAAPPERYQWVESLPAAEVATINSRIAEFQTRPLAKQQSLGELAEQIAARPDAEELRRTALAYEAMVGRLPASEQASIRQMGDDQRLRLIKREARGWARDVRLELNATERQAFRKAIDASIADGGIAARIESQSIGLPPGFVERIKARPKLAPFALTWFIAFSDRGPGRDGRGRDGRSERVDRFVERLKAVWVEWFEDVQRGLPERIQEELATARNNEHRARMLLGLLRENTTTDLGSVFADLPPDEMERVMLLPKDQFTETLDERLLGGRGDGPRDFEGRGFEGRGFGRPRDFNGFSPPGGPGQGPPPFEGRPPRRGPPEE